MCIENVNSQINYKVRLKIARKQTCAARWWDIHFINRLDKCLTLLALPLIVKVAVKFINILEKWQESNRFRE